MTTVKASGSRVKVSMTIGMTRKQSGDNHESLGRRTMYIWCRTLRRGSAVPQNPHREAYLLQPATKSSI